MSGALVLGFRGGDAPQNNSRYAPVGISVHPVTNTSLANAQIKSPAGDYSHLSVQILTFYGPANTLRLYLNVNGVDTALAVEPPAGLTGRFENVSTVVTVAEGDLVCMRWRGSGAPYTNTNGPTSLLFTPVAEAPTHNYVSMNMSTRLTQVASGSFAPVNGFAGTSTAEDQNAALVRAPADISLLCASVSANSRATAGQFAFRVNGVDSALVLAIPAGLTGRFESTSAVVPIAAGDLISHHFTHGGGTGSTNFLWVGCRAAFTGGAFDVFAQHAGAGANISSGNTWSTGFGQSSFGSSNTELGQQIRVFIDATLSNLRALVTANNNVLTLVPRINGSTGNQVLALPSGATGYFEDLVNVDPIFEGDLFALQSTSPSGLARFSWIGVTWTVGQPIIDLIPDPDALQIEGEFPLIFAGLDLEPLAGELVIEGAAAAIGTVFQMRPDAGELAIEGFAPQMGADGRILPLGGRLEVSGSLPALLVGIALAPPPGGLVVDGALPAIMTEVGALATQQAVLALGELAPNVSASQLATLAIAEIIPPARASQQAALVMAEVIPPVAASQQAILVLGDGDPCVTERAQIWTITRRDGVVFRYTSLDRDLRYGGQVYDSCRSLNPSASENASTLGSTGNIELDGIIDDDGISEADLYGGLFDDAYVTVDLVSWGVPAEAPRRLASGWTGELSQGETGFRMEVLGAGSRIDQQALVQMVTPGCRWVFGSPECGVDVEALAMTGTVTAAASRGRFLALLSNDGAGRQWENGTVRWTSGANVGQVVEVKTVDFGTGAITLWASPAFLPAAGDAFTLLPGCDKVREGGCTVYANVINHGGFPDVPGSDSLLETPDAKY